jgi:putative transposase
MRSSVSIRSGWRRSSLLRRLLWLACWKEFLSRHWDVLVAADFFTVEVWTRSGLTRILVLFLLDLSTRRVEIAGIATKADGIWMDQVVRNLFDDGAGFLTGKRYLIHDRDPLFTTTFLATLAANGVKSVKLPPRSPALSEFQKLRPKCDQSRLQAGDSRASPGL